MPKVTKKELEIKCEEYLMGWKRALADYDNLKRDLAKERDESRRYIIESVADGFLKVLDNFDKATKHTPNLDSCDEATKKQVEAWISGVGYVRTGMVDELKSLGLESFEPEVGSEYDSDTQEIVESREDEEEEGKILEITSRGWKIGEKIIRPACVVISK